MNPTDQAIGAAVTGDAALLKTLLDQGVPVSTKTEGTSSLLKLAIAHEHTQVVRLLLERGANPRLSKTDAAFPISPLESAVCGSNTDISGLLLDYGASAEDETYRRRRTTGAQKYYSIAIENDQPNQVIYLEGRGWEPFDAGNGTELFYELLLHMPRKFAAMDFLIARGAEPSRGMWRIPDVADVLIAGGRTMPPECSAWNDFQYIPQPMTPRHPLWKVREWLQASEGLRHATQRELAGFASYGVAASVLEFFAHFLPLRRGALPELSNFDGMMLHNGDLYPALCQHGYFFIGHEGSGDIYAIGREVLPGRATPPIFRFDHEEYDDDSAAANLPDSAKKIADDLIDFFEPLVESLNPRAPEEESQDSNQPCSRCGSMESLVMEKDDGPYRYCMVCSQVDPFTG